MCVKKKKKERKEKKKKFTQAIHSMFLVYFFSYKLSDNLLASNIEHYNKTLTLRHLGSKCHINAYVNTLILQHLVPEGVILKRLDCIPVSLLSLIQVSILVPKYDIADIFSQN